MTPLTIQCSSSLLARWHYERICLRSLPPTLAYAAPWRSRDSRRGITKRKTLTAAEGAEGGWDDPRPRSCALGHRSRPTHDCKHWLEIKIRLWSAGAEVMPRLRNVLRRNLNPRLGVVFTHLFPSWFVSTRLQRQCALMIDGSDSLNVDLKYLRCFVRAGAASLLSKTVVCQGLLEHLYVSQLLLHSQA